MEIKNLFDLPEIRGIVKQRKAKSFSIKIVFKSTEIAQDFAQDLEEFINENESRLKYLKDTIDLKDIFISDVFHNVIINYSFNSLESAKEIEQAFSLILEEDYSNLLTTLLLNNYTKQEKMQSSKLILNLPIDSSIFKNEQIESVTLKNNSIIITRELGLHNGKEIFMDVEDFSTPFLNIRLHKYDNLQTVLKDWVIIEKVKKEALIYSAWALSPDYFVGVISDGISCRTEEGKLISIPLSIIKEDNQIVEVIPDGGDYRIVSERLKDTIVPKELLIFN